MIKAHKIRTLQEIGHGINDIYEEFLRVNESMMPTDEELDTADMLAGFLLEKIALWRTNYAHHFGGNKGVRIRD